MPPLKIAPTVPVIGLTEDDVIRMIGRQQIQIEALKRAVAEQAQALLKFQPEGKGGKKEGEEK